ncbi:MAG: hypothetical protein ACPGTQ_08135 [Colwellia sp.]
MRLSLEKLDLVYEKLKNYQIHLNEFKVRDIIEFQQVLNKPKVTSHQFKEVLLNFNSYRVRRTLYIATDKVVDLEIGRYLTMMSPSIFRYKDLKIVTTNVS